MKLLVLEESPAFLAGVKRILEGRGHICLGATSWPDALRLTREMPDAALIAVAMPVVSGVELVKLIRKFWPRLPIALMGNEPEATYVQQAQAAGADAYLCRQSLPHSLEPLLGDLVARAKAAAPPQVPTHGAWLISRAAMAPIRLVPGQAVKIGRDQSNELVIATSDVSRHHATVSVIGSGGATVAEVTDNSRNGTWVDGRRVQGLATVRQDATIRVGEQEVELYLRLDVEAATTRAANLFEDTRAFPIHPAQPSHTETQRLQAVPKERRAPK